MAKKLSREELQSWMKKVASDPEVRKEFCAAQAEMLLPNLNRQSTARTAFKTEPVGDGQPNFPISFDDIEMAWVAPKITGVPQVQLEAEEIFIPIWQIVVGYEFRMELAEEGRLDMAAEAERQMLNRLKYNEDLAAWNMIKAVVANADFSSDHTKEIGTADNGSVSTATGEGYLSKSLINDIFTQSTVARRLVDNLWMSPLSAGDIRDWVPVDASPASVTENEQDKILRAGGIESMFGIKFNMMDDATLVDNQEVYAIDTRTFGKMPIKQELTTYESTTAIERFHIGTFGRERIGLGVIDWKALVKGVIDR